MSEPREMSEQETYELWLKWVTDNLGRDSLRANEAAVAATRVAVEGAGVAAVEEAAREAWAAAGPMTAFRLPMWALVGAASLVTVVVAGAVVVFATPAGCGIAQKVGLQVGGRCTANTVAAGAITGLSPQPRVSPAAQPTLSGAGGYSTPSSAPNPPVISNPQPTHNPAFPPYEYPASTGLPPMYPSVSAVSSGAAGTCRLPVYANGPGSGGFISLPDESFVADPKSSVAIPAGTPAPPPGPGVGQPFYGLTYDRAYTKWLPVGYNAVSPDGKHYAYGTQQGIYVVNVVDGSSTEVATGHAWTVLDTESAGVYAIQVNSAGLWWLTFAGDTQQLTADGYWQAVGGGAAYGTATSAVPQGAASVILRFDLSTKATQSWFEVDSAQSTVIGFDSKGAPIIESFASVTNGPSGYQGNYQEVWLAPTVGGAKVIIDSDAFSYLGSVGTIVVSDSHGIWFGGNGIYLYTGTTLEKVSDIGGWLAGGCA